LVIASVGLLKPIKMNFKWESRAKCSIEIPLKTQKETQKNNTVYNFDTIDVDGKPEVLFKCLKILVGERGFEPPTPWSRTRCSTRLSHSPTRLRAATRKAIHPRSFTSR
jgi:hypothetical protein